VVLPNGDVVKTASRARKSAAGFVFSLQLFSCSLFGFPFLRDIIYKLKNETYACNCLITYHLS